MNMETKFRILMLRRVPKKQKVKLRRPQVKKEKKIVMKIYRVQAHDTVEIAQETYQVVRALEAEVQEQGVQILVQEVPHQGKVLIAIITTEVVHRVGDLEVEADPRGEVRTAVATGVTRHVGQVEILPHLSHPVISEENLPEGGHRVHLGGKV